MINIIYNEITDNEFELLRNIIFKESGINLTERKKALIQSRLMKRLRVLKLDSYKTYYGSNISYN